MISQLGFARRTLAASMAAGTAVCYVCGLFWFTASSGCGLLQGLTACVIPFIPGDVLKVIFAVSIAMRLQKSLSLTGLSVHSS